MPDIDTTVSSRSKTLLIGHRGASRDAPENTLGSFNLAWQQGADGIEADFRLTRDGRVVCLHDAGTGRTGGVDLTVAESSYDELLRLDVGHWKGSRWQGERIPSLEEVLERLPDGKLFFMELKSGVEIIEPIRRVLNDSGVPFRQLRFLAFDATLITRLKDSLPDVRVYLNLYYRWNLRRRSWSPNRDELMEKLEKCGADGLSSQSRATIDKELVNNLHRNGREIHVWTVDSPHIAGRYLEMGVDAIMTNRPGWLRDRVYK